MANPIGDNLAREPHLRVVAAQVREEWRADAQAETDDAIAQRHRNRTLTEELRDAMARGDRVNIRCYNVRAAGVIIEVDKDLISLRNAGAGRIDLHRMPGLPIIMMTNEVAAEAGRVAGIMSGGFHGRMAECEASGDEYAISVVGEAEAIDGRVEVGADVATLISRLGARMVIPIDAVIAISPRL